MSSNILKRWNEVMLNLWDQAVIFILNASFLDEGAIAESEAVVSVSKLKGLLLCQEYLFWCKTVNYLQGAAFR